MLTVLPMLDMFLRRLASDRLRVRLRMRPFPARLADPIDSVNH